MNSSTTYYSLLTTHYSLLTTYYILLQVAADINSYSFIELSPLPHSKLMCSADVVEAITTELAKAALAGVMHVG